MPRKKPQPAEIVAKLRRVDVLLSHVRPAHLREERADRRLLANRSGKRRIVVALRQRGGRTLTRAFLRETDGVDFAQTRIAPGAVVSADEGPHWDPLEPAFDMRRIAHADAYSRDNVHTNQAESCFSPLRRRISGQHHRLGARHLGAYAVQAAWLEDHRDQSNGALADRLIGNALAAPVSRTWKGYWQRRASHDRVPWPPDAHALALLDHPHEPPPLGVAQRLDQP